MNWYALDEDNQSVKLPVGEVPDLEAIRKRVNLWHSDGRRSVSTTFLGMDHAFGSNTPLLFETLVFEPADSLSEIDGCRYETYELAKEGHRVFVDKYLTKPITDRRMIKKSGRGWDL